MSDNYVYENANSTAVEDQPMTNKIWEIAPDSNGRSYNSGQVIITTEALANGGRYINYDEGFLQIPVFECLSATNAGAELQFDFSSPERVDSVLRFVSSNSCAP